ncbi:single-stranded DNA-binding protein [Propionibacterium sp.]|uniref:single-stranded DNA-binding protein n=1 Tax=Propionibacterium sp. TaxID=1977903 RepID=UPI0039ECC606
MSTITFAGNLAADPELRFTPSGRAVARLTVIENRRRRGEDGQWQDAEPNVFRVQVWGSAAQNVAESVGKGDRVHVTGSVATDRWQDKESQEDRTAQYVKADEVSVSLRYHIAHATKAARTHTEAQDTQDHED